MKSLLSFNAKLFTIIALILLSTNIIYGQNANDALRLGFSGLSSDARALGMGDSYIGLSDDAGAAFFNPAGFGLIKKMELSAGLSYDNYTNNTSFLGQSSNYSASATRLNNFSFALPFPTVKGSLVFAVAYHTTHDFTSALKFNGYNGGNTSMIQNLNDAGSYIPYDLFLTDTNYVTPINGHLNQSGTILGSGETHAWTFSGAIEAYKNLFIGMNLNFSSGSYTSNNDYYEDDFNGYYSNTLTDPETPATRGFQTFNLNRVLNWDITGWDFKFGMIYQLNNSRIGLTVQLPKTYTVKENFDVNGYSLFSNGYSPSLDPANYSDHVEYDIVTPLELGLGFSTNISSLILSAQATIIDYSQLKFENPDGISDADISSINKSIKDNLRSVINLNVGAEYTIPDVGLRLRAGYLRQPSAYQGDPSSFDRNYITCGIGYLADEAVGIDLAYAHGWWSDYGDNYSSGVSVTNQDIKVDRVILSTTYRF
jgi:long-subunit fatty acid transport protein